uniref:Pleckstrin homology domain-containing family A member 8 n=1 Tax=Neogobius melanostomus TaxID=47308 RepID=A0A8C6T0A3_9GOBI
MEGILHKWTNYISGWQPRWFVLEGGTLSYYDSQEDAWKGCKGSIKVSVCEIQVHSTDSTRVDLTIPGEQYFYLRAINAAERQKWLVALGTAKACLTDNRTKREKELQENTEALKTKMSELRLYCDLLLQQVNKIKESDELGNLAETGLDTGDMVKSTCTTFLKTLEECMQIATRTFNTDIFSDINLDDDNGIPTQEFLDSCYAIVPVLDKLGSTVFAPVKMDFVGNIKKIHQKLLSDSDNFPTLQSIVLHEVEREVAHVRNSATEALLWLRRGLKFLMEFLSEVNEGQTDVPRALNNSYGKTLRRYHGWVVRGVFALALRAAPSYAGFTAALVTKEGDELKSSFSSGIHRDLDVYLPAMGKQLAILDALYEEYNLESDEVV